MHSLAVLYQHLSKELSNEVLEEASETKYVFLQYAMEMNRRPASLAPYPLPLESPKSLIFGHGRIQYTLSK